jgi:hypothetical protein
MADKRPTGQAYSKDKNYIYTWYTDGTVTRHRAVGSWSSQEERIDRSVVWNERDFWAFVPIAE